MRTEHFTKNAAGNLIHQNFPFASISDVKVAQRDAGMHWFDKGAMRFFRGRVATETYAGGFFVSSEKQRDEEPRLYTVRRAMPNGAVETVGDFQAHTSKARALVALLEERARVTLGRESITVTRRGRKWEVVARGWDFGDGYGVIVVVECLYKDKGSYGNFTLDDRPTREQERVAVAKLLANASGDDKGLRKSFRRIRAAEHQGWWIPSLYQVGAI